MTSRPAITVTNVSNTVVTEGGGATYTYTVVLDTAPTSDVTITLNSGTQLSTNVTSLTFTTANWNVAQTVTVTVIDDTVGEGNHTGVITSTVTSTDTSYNGLTVAPVQVTITDNDLPTSPREYTAQTGTANPFNGIDIGNYSTPTLADIDGDGDLDAIVGELDGTLKYYKNTGSSTAPVYTEQTGAANPFNGIDIGASSTPTLADIDGDGDLDAIVGESDGTLNYYQNTGSSTAPVYTEQTGTANPFNGIDIGASSTPTLADIDGDGDLDAIVGENGGILYYFQGVAPLNSAPTAVTLTNKQTAIAENTSTATRIKVADIAITDDGVGTNDLSLTGDDASFFEVVGTELYLKAGTALNFEAKTSYSVNVGRVEGEYYFPPLSVKSGRAIFTAPSFRCS